jgi:hypothetical protein
VNGLNSGGISLKYRLRCGNAKRIVVVVANGLKDVLLSVIHIEKANAKLSANNTTKLVYRNLYRIDG